MILLVNGLIKADVTPYLIYTDFVTRIRSSCGLFLCSWLTCGIAMACTMLLSGYAFVFEFPFQMQHLLEKSI